MNTRTFENYLIILVPLLFMSLFFIIPAFSLAAMSFTRFQRGMAVAPTISLENYVRFLSDPFYIQVTLRTLFIGLIATLISILLGYPLAYKLAKSTGAAKSILMLIVMAPLLVDVVTKTYAWMILLADDGLVNSFLFTILGVRAHLMYNVAGVIIGTIYSYLPFMVLSVSSVIENIDPSLEEVARTLGAGGYRRFVGVVLPLSTPGVLAGSILVFVLSTSTYAIPTLMSGTWTFMVLPVLIYQQVLQIMNWPFGATVAFIQLAISLVLVIGYYRITQRLVGGREYQANGVFRRNR